MAGPQGGPVLTRFQARLIRRTARRSLAEALLVRKVFVPYKYGRARIGTALRIVPRLSVVLTVDELSRG